MSNITELGYCLFLNLGDIFFCLVSLKNIVIIMIFFRHEFLKGPSCLISLIVIYIYIYILYISLVYYHPCTHAF